MMRKLFIPLIAACLSGMPAFAQNSYKDIENFSEGTTLVFQDCQSEGFDPGKSGKGITWDFSGLKSSPEVVTERIAGPDSVKAAGDFPGTNLVEKYSDGSYVFLKKEEDKTYLLGFTAEQPQIKIHYPQPVLIAQRPFGYGARVSEPFTTDYSVNNLNFSGKGTITIEADGYGTLILPNASYKNALRIKMVQKQADELTQYHSTSETTITTYVWFDKEHHSALLKASETKSAYRTDLRVSYLLKETLP